MKIFNSKTVFIVKSMNMNSFFSVAFCVFVPLFSCVCVCVCMRWLGHDECLRAFIMLFWILALNKYQDIFTHIHTHSRTRSEINQIKSRVKYTQWLIKMKRIHGVFFRYCWYCCCLPHSSWCLIHSWRMEFIAEWTRMDERNWIQIQIHIERLENRQNQISIQLPKSRIFVSMFFSLSLHSSRFRACANLSLWIFNSMEE